MLVDEDSNPSIGACHTWNKAEAGSAHASKKDNGPLASMKTKFYSISMWLPRRCWIGQCLLRERSPSLGIYDSGWCPVQLSKYACDFAVEQFYI
jgi:hypothetical protein